MDRQEILNNLQIFDKEIADVFNCCKEKAKFYIVGGSAFMLWGLDGRATRDIDVLEIETNNPVDKQLLSRTMHKCYMNKDVQAYYDKFPVGFENRATKLNVESKYADFYILSLEDLVISKLCTTRFEQDVTDVQTEFVTKRLDWHLLETLAASMENSMISSQGYRDFSYQYKKYLEDCGEANDRELT